MHCKSGWRCHKSRTDTDCTVCLPVCTQHTASFLGLLYSSTRIAYIRVCIPVYTSMHTTVVEAQQSSSRKLRHAERACAWSSLQLRGDTTVPDLLQAKFPFAAYFAPVERQQSYRQTGRQTVCTRAHNQSLKAWQVRFLGAIHVHNNV